jgi:hypothetical protein
MIFSKNYFLIYTTTSLPKWQTVFNGVGGNLLKDLAARELQAYSLRCAQKRAALRPPFVFYII